MEFFFPHEKKIHPSSDNYVNICGHYGSKKQIRLSRIYFFLHALTPVTRKFHFGSHTHTYTDLIYSFIQFIRSVFELLLPSINEFWLFFFVVVVVLHLKPLETKQNKKKYNQKFLMTKKKEERMERKRKKTDHYHQSKSIDN